MCEDKIHMLTQPLLTEEGFVNEACMNELTAAINNMPPTYERLADRPEWSKPRLTFLHEITGALAKYAVRLSPYHLPAGLETVLGYVTSCLERDVEWGPAGMAELSLCDINRLLHNILMDQGIKPFDAWNESKRDWREEEIDERPEDPDYDFIDLHALLHNVCLDIRMERRAFDPFNEKFDEAQTDG